MSNSHEESLKAGFNTLSADQQAGIDRFRSLYEEERRVLNHVPDLLAFVRRMSNTVCDHGPGNPCTRMDARALLAKMGVTP